jgi:hypothetical protein
MVDGVATTLATMPLQIRIKPTQFTLQITIANPARKSLNALSFSFLAVVGFWCVCHCFF